MGNYKHRPAMKDLGAELLHRAPATGKTAAATMKPVKLDAVGGSSVKGGVSKPRPRATSKLNPKTIIEIISDNPESLQFIPNNPESFVITSSRKKVHTHSPVLSLESKVGNTDAATMKPVKLDAVGGAAVKGGVSKPRPRATSKLNPKTIIEIISDNPESLEFIPNNPESFVITYMRKNVRTQSSVLSLGSKAACGTTVNKPMEIVQDIDALDMDDQLAVATYVKDIYKFSENSCRPRDYMGSQVEINAEMRANLADWVIGAHEKLKLIPKTLYLTFYIIDRYLSLEMVSKRELQLVGVTAMFIACKYEETTQTRAPKVNDFICMLNKAPLVNDVICKSNRAFSREQILAKEKRIVHKLEWNLAVPTPYVFLVCFLKAAFSDKEMEHMAFFLAELGLMQYSMITYRPSMIAASAVYVARCTLRKTPLWSETLQCHTGFSEPQLMECAKRMVKFHLSAAESRLKVVYNKYSSPEHCAVALRPPATKFL